MIPTTFPHVKRALRLAGVVALACSAPSLTHAQSHIHNVTLSAGTVIIVRLDKALSSNESNKGDRFTATVQERNGQSNPYALPSGTQVAGVVRLVRPKKAKDPGVLDLTFQRINFPDGRTDSLNGSLIGLDNKSVTHDKQGRLIARKSHRIDRLTFVGYGAGAGFLLGLLTDKKNTFRDVTIGAGLGYLYGALEKDRSKVNDVRLKEGTELGVRLDSSITYARAGPF